MTPEEIEKLPRVERTYCSTYDRTETYLALDAERMCQGRGIPKFQLGQVLGDKPLTFHKDHYVDCPNRFCRRDRAQFLADALGNRERAGRKMVESSRDDIYWCNDCQGTGWVLESWDAVNERLDILTWEKKAAALSTDELVAAQAKNNPVMFQYRGEGWPPEILAKEMARRLAACAA